MISISLENLNLFQSKVMMKRIKVQPMVSNSDDVLKRVGSRRRKKLTLAKCANFHVVEIQ